MGGSAGGSSGLSSGFPVLFNYEQLLTPWQKTGQPWATSFLQNQVAGGGMTPQQEGSLWGQARQQIEDATGAAGRGFGRQLASSGISLNSPSVAGGWSDIMSNKIKSTAGAASEFIKTKLGQSNTVMNQLLTALFTPPPAAVGQITSQTSKASGVK